jgi:hypothetical protein
MESTGVSISQPTQNHPRTHGAFVSVDFWRVDGLWTYPEYLPVDGGTTPETWDDAGLLMRIGAVERIILSKVERATPFEAEFAKSYWAPILPRCRQNGVDELHACRSVFEHI